MIHFIDLVGNSDAEGNPIGHPLKVVRLFQELLKNYTIQKILPSNYAGYTDADRFVPYNRRLMKTDILSKVFNVIYKIYYYAKLRKICKDTILLINTDIYLLLAISLLRKHSTAKVLAIVYVDYLKKASPFKKRVVKKAYSKIDYIITNEFAESSIEEKKKIVLPDYFYVNEYYSIEKKEIKYDFLMLGIISKSKNIEDVLEAIFSKKGKYSIRISGHFDDNHRFLSLSQKYKHESYIQIENEYIDDAKYKQLFSECRFLVMPYHGEDYSDRGSGVFYDSLFYKTPIIGTDIGLFKILEKMKMGILYRNSFAEVFESLEKTDINTFHDNIQAFCEQHAVEKYREIFRNILS